MKYPLCDRPIQAVRPARMSETKAPRKARFSKFRRVALIMGQDIGYCRDVLRGIQAFATGHESWIFHDAAPDLRILQPLKEWKPQGIIAHLFQEELAEELRALGKPLVNTTSTLADLELPLVEIDHHAVGRMGAEHFLQGGFRNFGYFGSRTAGFSIGREQGFCRRLQEAGYSCSSCYAEYMPRPDAGGSWVDIDKRVHRWITALPKPVGILASNDVPARTLAEVCRQLDLNVPTDVAILGVDNDDVETGLAYPPLSSIALPSERVGFEAAALLSRLMAGQEPPSEPLFLPPQGVVVRQSSDVVAVSDPELSAILNFIRRHGTEPIGVEDVTAQVGASRRKLERKFRAAMHRTIHDEIRRVRIERAKRLLSTTDLAMPAIANRSGFDSARRLATVFRKQTGTTPTAYRRQFRLC